MSLKLTPGERPALDEIHLALDAVHCIIGIFPEERTNAQPVAVAATLWVDLETAARSGALDATVDYAKAAHAIATILSAGHFRLLETAGLAILSYLLAPVTDAARPTRARVTLTKPGALGGQARASVSMERMAEALPYTNDVLFTSPDATIARKNGLLAVTALT